MLMSMPYLYREFPLVDFIVYELPRKGEGGESFGSNYYGAMRIDVGKGVSIQRMKKGRDIERFPIQILPGGRYTG